MIPDGLVAYVKRACPTCTLIEPQMRQVARKLADFSVVSQDDPKFPAGVERVVVARGPFSAQAQLRGRRIDVRVRPSG